MSASTLCNRLASISGASAIALASYGAHGLQTSDEYYNEIFKKANQYHMLHSFLFLAAPHTKYPKVVSALTATGILCFSGSLYALALREDRMFGKITPWGGIAFIGAWLSIGL